MKLRKENLLIGKPALISYETTEEILNQMKNNICKIKTQKGEQGTGFFCKIPFPSQEQLLPVLITNNHVINQESLNNNENISIMIRNEKKAKIINLNKRINYTNPEYDITIIELTKEDNIQNFFELDDNILYNILEENDKNEDKDVNSNQIYLKETVYILQYPEGKLSVSYGILEDIYLDSTFNFNHSCSTTSGSSGSPIVNLLTKKIIGIHKEGIQNANYNRGTFLNYPIRAFIKYYIQKQPKLTGILKSILVKYISFFIKDINLIDSEEIRQIIFTFKKDLKIKEDFQNNIKLNLGVNIEKNIFAFSKYIYSIITEKEINDLLKFVSSNEKNQIIQYWNFLSKYEEINQIFEQELSKAIENSYFEYSLINISINEKAKLKEFFKKMEYCPNLVRKFLFHGTQLDIVSKILANGFLYSRMNFFGIGIYFTDLLDYSVFFSGGKNFGKILSINETFSCVSAEIYYNNCQKKNIYDHSLYTKEFDHFPTYEEIKRDYPDKLVEKNGIHFARIEPYNGGVRNKENIREDLKKGKFLGNEYIITEFEQILPLYGLTFKRDEYLIIWRDPNFERNNKCNQYLEEKKIFIYKYSKMNAYFESSIEKALEIIKRKKYNKIILISNVGLDLSGKRFVEIARYILGFNVAVLFFSSNKNHLSWIKNFPNAFFTDNDEFFKEYILNYNDKGLLNLKKNIENYYKIKLNFFNDFLQFPKFAEREEYKNLIFNEPIPYFKRVIIKNSNKNCILCIDNDMKPCFKSTTNLDINLFFWYLTIKDNEITLYSNDGYLGVNTELKKIIGEKSMKIFKFDKINSRDYLIYYKDKNNVLTIKGNNAVIEKENSNKSNQIFNLIEYMDSIN